jgi:hypothetical protein
VKVAKARVRVFNLNLAQLLYPTPPGRSCYLSR